MASAPRVYAPFAGLLSYLVPGLGQIYQGRIGKGLLFMICLIGMFFWGMHMGDWKNVHLPHSAEKGGRGGAPMNGLTNIYNRPQFAGQFWIGVAAWPALWQYNDLPVPSEQASPFWHNFERTPYERRALVGQEPLTRDEARWDWPGQTVNELQVNGDKTWDLAWVYTVIAGVLNVLVIYDAVAGPAFIEEERRLPREAT